MRRKHRPTNPPHRPLSLSAAETAPNTTGVCLFSRSIPLQRRLRQRRHLEDAQERYNILARLFAAHAEDLGNLVADFERSEAGEELAWEEAAALRDQPEDREARFAAAGEEYEFAIAGLRLLVARKGEGVEAGRSVVEMRSVERDLARGLAEKLEERDGRLLGEFERMAAEVRVGGGRRPKEERVKDAGEGRVSRPVAQC